MKIVFMGTPDFAVPTLEKLIEHHEVTGVVTQPDKPKGRGQKMQFTPVKELAVKNEIPVYQPNKLRNDIELIDTVKGMKPDAIVVVAYGQILPKEVLDIPRLGCINVHASILPKLRGAAPINYSIINGFEETGVTTMLMAEGLDTGDMLLKAEIEIEEGETAGELHDRLMTIGADLLIETLRGLEEGNIIPEKQIEELSSYAPMLKKDLGHINWDDESKNIFNLIRGVTPWPGAYSYYNDKTIKIWRAELEDSNSSRAPGTILRVSKDGIKVACKNGAIIVKEIQEVGSKRMEVSSYLNGHDVKEGDILK